MEDGIAASAVIQPSQESPVDCPLQALSNEPLPIAHESLLDTDGDRIGGFVWKFPSEGSNALPGGSNSSLCEAADLQTPPIAVYPRKCRYCQRAWVSSYVHERRHWKLCAPDPSPENVFPSSLGVPRRVWCEVDSALSSIQWRDDEGAKQDSDACRIAFHEMIDVRLLAEPCESFQVTTRAGRRIVFQYRDDRAKQNEFKDQEGYGVTRALDARQWTEYLQMFSRFTQDQALEMNCEEAATPSEAVTAGEIAQDEDLLKEMQRVIQANDVDALEEILHDDELMHAISLTDSNGSSLLVQAIQSQIDCRIIQTLLKAGVDCNAKNRDGESPLLLAAASGDLMLLHLLLQAPEIRENQRCALGATAFHAAANAGDVAALRLLCEHGHAAVTYVDENGWTGLHYAAACGSGRDAVAFLCELIPDLVDATCIQGNTALHVAAGCGCEQNVRVLLETAANPHITNADGHTAYHVALHNHHIACAISVNEYMETPRDAYERVATIASTGHRKEDRVGRVEHTESYGYSQGGHDHSTDSDNDTVVASAWIEYYTEDHMSYYFNSITGESTWYKPKPLEKSNLFLPPPPPVSFPPEPDNDIFPRKTDNIEAVAGNHCQQLPLCMIPLVSPLVSLDDPTAATKFDSRRKKDRERRRSQKLKSRNSTHKVYEPQGPLPPPPPSEHRLVQQQRRRSSASVHHYEVQ